MRAARAEPRRLPWKDARRPRSSGIDVVESFVDPSIGWQHDESLRLGSRAQRSVPAYELGLPLPLRSQGQGRRELQRIAGAKRMAHEQLVHAPDDARCELDDVQAIEVGSQACDGAGASGRIQVSCSNPPVERGRHLGFGQAGDCGSSFGKESHDERCLGLADVPLDDRARVEEPDQTRSFRIF